MEIALFHSFLHSIFLPISHLNGLPGVPVLFVTIKWYGIVPLPKCQMLFHSSLAVFHVTAEESLDFTYGIRPVSISHQSCDERRDHNNHLYE